MRKARVSYLYPMHEFKIADAEAHRQWEDLLGLPIQADTIKLTHQTYEAIADKVQVIQLAAALRTRNC